MSKGYAGVPKTEFKASRYYNLSLDEKDWCDYKRECPMQKNINGKYCHVCKYHRELDIPYLLAERGQK